MITKLYSIKDTKATFWKPHVQLNDLVARREFSNMINSSANEFFSVNYSDLELWCIGEYDDITGKITAFDPVFVCNGVDVKDGDN